jgi:hypothetical protein
MVAGIFLLGKHYSWIEYFSTSLMVIGLSGFSIADAQGTGTLIVPNQPYIFVHAR